VRHTQRIQKTLEDANVKLTEAISDILGTSGRAILKALMTGETDPERLVDLTTGRLKASRARLVEALRGRVTPHHRFMITVHLTQIEALETAVTTIEARIGDALVPFRAAVNVLTTMPGLRETAAAVILAEIGDNVSPVPTAGHRVSWAGLCPRLDESAGNRRSTRPRQGAPWLKTTLVQAAWAATRRKDGYFHAQFLRLKSRGRSLRRLRDRQLNEIRDVSSKMAHTSVWPKNPGDSRHLTQGETASVSQFWHGLPAHLTWRCRPIDPQAPFHQRDRTTYRYVNCVEAFLLGKHGAVDTTSQGLM